MSDELHKLAAIHGQISVAKERIKKAEQNLRLLQEDIDNNSAEELWYNNRWRVTLTLRKKDYFNQAVTVDIVIPYGVVQQQLVYELSKAKRELVRLEGEAVAAAKELSQ